MECLGGYTFLVMTFVIFFVACKRGTSMECLGGYTFFVMTFVILSGGLKMRDEHGMLRGVYISRHQFCHTFR